MTSVGHDPQLVDRLRRHVDMLAGVIGVRHLSQPETFQSALGYLEQELANAGVTGQREPYMAGGHQVANLVVDFPGRIRAEQVLVVGAHYDTVEGSPGADDNASAVAVLIELARLLQDCPVKKTVRLVAFACEEQPYFHACEMGSQVHARRCRTQGEQLIGMLSLEMLGYFRSEEGSQRVPRSLPRLVRPWVPTRGDFLAAVGNLKSWRLGWQFRRGFKRHTRLPLLSLALPESVEEIRRSDNSSFWDQGYAALMITDTSFLRNPHYHLPCDTPDTLDYERMAEATLGVYGGILHIADGEGRSRKTGTR